MRSSRPVHPTLKTGSEKWCQFEIIAETVKAVLGLKKCEHWDWFDENDKCITPLLHEKNQAYMEWQKDPNPNPRQTNSDISRGQAQKGLWEMKDHWWDRKADEVQKSHWWDRKADEVQKYADLNNSKHFFGAPKTVYGPSWSGPTPLLSAEGSTLIKDQDALREQWAEHFSNLLNRTFISQCHCTQSDPSTAHCGWA